MTQSSRTQRLRGSIIAQLESALTQENADEIAGLIDYDLTDDEKRRDSYDLERVAQTVLDKLPNCAESLVVDIINALGIRPSYGATPANENGKAKEPKNSTGEVVRPPAPSFFHGKQPVQHLVPASEESGAQERPPQLVRVPVLPSRRPASVMPNTAASEIVDVPPRLGRGMNYSSMPVDTVTKKRGGAGTFVGTFGLLLFGGIIGFGEYIDFSTGKNALGNSQFATAFYIVVIGVLISWCVSAMMHNMPSREHIDAAMHLKRHNKFTVANVVAFIVGLVVSSFTTTIGLLGSGRLSTVQIAGIIKPLNVARWLPARMLYGGDPGILGWGIVFVVSMLLQVIIAAVIVWGIPIALSSAFATPSLAKLSRAVIAKLVGFVGLSVGFIILAFDLLSDVILMGLLIGLVIWLVCFGFVFLHMFIEHMEEEHDMPGLQAQIDSILGTHKEGVKTFLWNAYRFSYAIQAVFTICGMVGVPVFLHGTFPTSPWPPMFEPTILTFVMALIYGGSQYHLAYTNMVSGITNLRVKLEW